MLKIDGVFLTGSCENTQLPSENPQIDSIKSFSEFSLKDFDTDLNC